MDNLGKKAITDLNISLDRPFNGLQNTSLLIVKMDNCYGHSKLAAIKQGQFQPHDIDDA